MKEETRTRYRQDHMAQVLDALCAAINEAVTASHRFFVDQSEEAAEEACLTSRTAVQLYFLAYSDFGPSATDKTDDLMQALQRNELLCNGLGRERGEASIISKYGESIAMRRKLMRGLLAGDHDLVRRLLREELSATKYEKAHV